MGRVGNMKKRLIVAGGSPGIWGWGRGMVVFGFWRKIFHQGKFSNEYFH